MSKRRLKAPPAPNKGGAGIASSPLPAVRSLRNGTGREQENGNPIPGPGSPIIGGGGGLSWQAARRLLFVTLALSLVLSVLFAARVPLANPDPRAWVNLNPDETAHRDYIRLLVEERGLVQFRVQDPEVVARGDEPERYETHQPPLYYLLCVPVYLATGGSLFALRLVSAVIQLATVWLTFRAVRDLFPDRAELALGAALFVAFLPAQAQLSGAVSNDPLTTLVAVAIFWRLGLLVKAGPGTGEAGGRGAVLLGALFGIGLLTKLSVLQLLPVIVLAYGIAARVQVVPPRRALAQAALALGLGVLIAAPWLVRNTVLYGDPLALKIYLLTGPNFKPAAIMQGFGWTFGDYLRFVGVRSFATFWYLLPPNLPPNRFTGAPLPLLLVLALGLGGLLGTLRWLQRLYGEPGQRRILGLCIAGILLLVPFYTRFILTTFQAQGRYFLPVLLPVALVACLGWATLAGRSRGLGALGVGGVLFAMSLYAALGGGFAG